MRAIWLRRTWRPSGRGMSSAAISSAVCTAARVRMDWIAPPRSARPPEASCCTCSNCREMSLLVTPKPLIKVGSRLTCTSRSTPPSRETSPTPLVASNSLVISLSTNHDKPCSSNLSEATVTVRIGLPAVLILETTGSVIAAGRVARMVSTALRTSFCATSLSLSTLNSTLTTAMLSVRLA